MIKVSDYIFDFMSDKGMDTIFLVSGGAAGHLLNSIANRDDFKYVCGYHEQACSMSAESYGRLKNKPACVLVTNGPGSTNAITGVSGAYGESIPMIVISGQVPTNQSLSSLPKEIKLRQFGVQECDVISVVTPMTKYAVQITDSKDIKYHLQRAFYEATTGRMGPVWLDIPLDIQNAMVDVDELNGYDFPHIEYHNPYVDVVDLISQSKKPLIVVGNGIHLSNTEDKFKQLVSKLKIPIVSTWIAKDLMNDDDRLFIGNFGLLGERSANLAIQNSDLLLILGSRLSIPNVGYRTDLFSPMSKKIMVDIDKNELIKPTLNIDYPIHNDLCNFFDDILLTLDSSNLPNYDDWIDLAKSWKSKYKVFKPEYKDNKNKINSFYFTEVLSDKLTDNNIVVTDMGTSYTCTMQSLKMNGKNRLFTSSTQASMGFGLPGAIGSYFACPDKDIILITGDGGLQMNIQELQSVIHHQIPMKIFVLNNNGYLAISLMQDNLFNGKYIGSNNQSGVGNPDFIKISEAYGLKSFRFNNNNDLENNIDEVLNTKGPVLCEIMMVENQLLVPRVQSRKDSLGNIVSTSLEDMYPHLDEDEMNQIKEKVESL